MVERVFYLFFIPLTPLNARIYPFIVMETKIIAFLSNLRFYFKGGA